MTARHRLDELLRDLADRMAAETALSRSEVRCALGLDRPEQNNKSGNPRQGNRDNPDNRRGPDDAGTGIAVPTSGNWTAKLMF